MSDSYPQLNKLLWVMDQLRDPETGCPWDIKQDFDSIVPFTIEEAYEVADAIDRKDWDDVKEELGDLLFQVVFYARLGKEQALFDFESIAQAMSEKLISRHPHVFSDKTFSEEEVKANWEATKAQERHGKGNSSVMDNIPLSLPALSRAAKMQKRCATVGFDWPDLEGVFDKIQEEIVEVKQELDKSPIDQTMLEEEIGDLLFATVNLARKLKKDPEELLRRANNKFERRFRKVEQHYTDTGLAIVEADLQNMEAVWQQVKNETKQD